MKKRVLIVIVILLIFLSIFLFNIRVGASQEITGKAITGKLPYSTTQITGKMITGKLPYSTTNISIFVDDTIAPAVFISKPENKTYHNYKLLNLSLYAYDTSLIQAAWYNIDYGNNVSVSVLGTIVSYNTTFNETEGSHVINFYVNDSKGNKNLTSLYFNINNSKILVLADEFTENESTTNFDNLTEQQLENITFSLANSYGIINLTESVNLTKYALANEINLDEHINISYNRIFLNSSFLTDFSSVSSRLRLNNLNFTNPRVLKDGQLCSSPDCIIKSYNSETGTLIFDVVGFTIYSVEETPSVSPAPPPGGGGGGITKPKKQLEFNQSSIKITIKQGETKQVYLKIKNIGQASLDVKMSASSIIEEFIRFKEKEFKLKANEEKEIEIDVIAKEKTIPDVYIGKIIAESKDESEEVIFVIEVESKGAVFDVNIEIPEKFKEVWPGESVLAKITIYDLERVGLVDVKVNYEIRDSEGKIILSEQEILAIETQLSFVREIKISKEAEPGEYIFYVKVSYNGKIGSASEIFRVLKLEKPKINKNTIITLAIIIIVLSLLMLVLSELHRLRRLISGYKETKKRIISKTKISKRPIKKKSK